MRRILSDTSNSFINWSSLCMPSCTCSVGSTWPSSSSVVDLWHIFLWHTESLTINHHHNVTATCCFVWRFTFLCFTLCLWLYSCHGCDIDCPRCLVCCSVWNRCAAVCPAWNRCATVCPAWNRGAARRAGLLCLFTALQLSQELLRVVSRTSSSPAPYGVDTI